MVFNWHSKACPRSTDTAQYCTILYDVITTLHSKVSPCSGGAVLAARRFRSMLSPLAASRLHRQVRSGAETLSPGAGRIAVETGVKVGGKLSTYEKSSIYGPRMCSREGTDGVLPDTTPLLTGTGASHQRLLGKLAMLPSMYAMLPSMHADIRSKLMVL